MNRTLKNLSFYVLLLLFLAILFQTRTQKPDITRLTYSELTDHISNQNIATASLSEQHVEGTFKDGQQFKAYVPPMLNDRLAARLTDPEAGIVIKGEPPSETQWLVSILVNWLPMIVLIGLWIFIIQRMNGSSSKAMSFGRSRARMFSPEEKDRVIFADVAGCDEAKEELEELVEYLKDPHKFQRLGGKIPKGVLLVGAPGTGKTLLARAVAGEAKVPFFSISGSDFVEMFVGVGASRVRDLFIQGKKSAPCLIFIDEIDAVGRQRGTGLGGGHDEREQTLNALLVEMDGFETNEGVILIAATNRPDVLDPALMRPGRFDREVIVDYPDIKGREAILRVHMKDIPVSDDVNISVIARSTPGLAGADLANLINESTLMAARSGRQKVAMQDLENAKDKVMMGMERRSRIISDEEKKIIAYHEAGHTLVAKLLPDSDPLHKVTIIPRGRALGVTHTLPERDTYMHDRQYFLDVIIKLLSGRITEQLVFDKTYTGAGNDLSVATRIAYSMVCELGMSDNLGPRTFGKREEHHFLGREISQVKDYSETTATRIDNEVSLIISECYEKATELIRNNMDNLHRIADALLIHETLDSSQIDMIMAGHEIEIPEPSDTPAGPDREDKTQVEDIEEDERTADDNDSAIADGSPATA